jgi:hypothetical protein
MVTQIFTHHGMYKIHVSIASAAWDEKMSDEQKGLRMWEEAVEGYVTELACVWKD